MQNNAGYEKENGSVVGTIWGECLIRDLKLDEVIGNILENGRL